MHGKEGFILRGFPPEWCFSKPGRERKVAIALAKWAKRRYACSKCFTIVRGITRDNYVEWFCPDIDVLVVTQSEVISHEVKLLEGKKTGLPTIVNAKTSEVIEELKTVRLVDKAIYNGVGQALFNSPKSDKSYLVLPSVRENVLNVVESLPIGLIKFNGEGDSFCLMKEAPYQRRNQLGDQIFKLGNYDEEEEKRCGEGTLNRLLFSEKF